MLANYDTNNIFAKILKGELPSHRLYEDSQCVAILDIFPINMGHLLVIPKLAATTVSELDPAVLGHLMEVASRLAKALRTASPRCEGVNFWLSDGEAAGQEVPHVHLHVIPRFQGDGFGFRTGTSNRQPADSDRLKALALEIRKSVGGT